MVVVRRATCPSQTVQQSTKEHQTRQTASVRRLADSFRIEGIGVSAIFHAKRRPDELESIPKHAF